MKCNFSLMDEGSEDMKGYVDEDECIGCELCPDICPEIFEMNDDGKAEAKDIEIAEDVEDSAKEAEESCPVDAITIQ